jgi:toxin CptA
VQFPITIGLRRSRFIDGGLGLVTLLASLMVLGFPQPLVTQWLLGGVIWICAVLTGWQLTPKFVAIRLERDGQVFIAHRDGEFLAAEMLPGATVHPWLTVLRLKTEENGACRLIATVDSLNRQDYRRLRVFLRWQADFSGLNDDV